MFYGDPFIKDGTLVTLIDDYNQGAQALGITYNEINEKVQGNAESDMKKVGGW